MKQPIPVASEEKKAVDVQPTALPLSHNEQSNDAGSTVTDKQNEIPDPQVSSKKNPKTPYFFHRAKTQDFGGV